MSLDLSLKNLEINFNVSNAGDNRVFEFKDFRLDAATKILYQSGKQVVLTPKAVETLIALAENPGQVISKEELMNKIWSDTIVEESNLAQYLYVLRKTLGNTEDGKPYIETFKRRGYRFNGTVSVTSNEITAINSGESFVDSSKGQPKALSSRGVERRGSVRALNQAAARESAPRINVERSDNVYSVTDWQREPAVDTAQPAVLPARSKWFLPFVVAALALALAGISFGVYKFSTSGTATAVQSVPFRGSDIIRITTSGKSKRAVISPDGRYIAHVSAGIDGDSLYVRQTAVANDTRIAGPTQAEIVWITPASDGNFVYYLTLERDKGVAELFRVPVLGGPVVKIAHDIGAPTFSPDGKNIAYMIQNQDESRLIVTDAGAGNEGLLMSRNAPHYLKPNEKVLVSRREPDYLNMFWYAPAWSVDGKSIAFPVNQSDQNGRYETLMAVDVDSGMERKLTDVRWQQVGQPRWLSDGLVLSASETSTGPQQLWHVSSADGSASRITRDLTDYQHLTLTADGKSLAAIQKNVVSNIWTVPGSMAGIKQIISEAGRFNEITWLPDGRLAYTSNAGGSSEIWTANSDGTNVKQLTVGANARLGLAVTNDEKQVVFAAEREGKYNLWRVNIDGSNPTQITKGDGEYYPQITPDGLWIVYQSGGNYPTLWKMPVSGGEPVQITKTSASRPSISPDGKFVAYHYLDSSFEKSRWGIGIINLENGERIKRFDFPTTVTERLVKWTRDGRSIAFLNSPGGIPNIWLQPIDGGLPKPLTDFQSDNIIAFNWNADGSQLAVIRGVETNDVVLIERSRLK